MKSLPFYSRKKKREYPEARLQKTIMQHLLLNGSCLVFSIPNERQCSPAAMRELKAMGLFAGAADLCIIVNGRAHFLEVKSEDGKQSDAQEWFEDCCNDFNCPYQIVRNISDALKTLTLWGAIRPAKVAA